MKNTTDVTLLTPAAAHRFHASLSPHPLVVRSAKASSNGALLVPHISVAGYDQIVWGLSTASGPKEVKDGDWIVEHEAFGVLVLSGEQFGKTFAALA